MCILSLLDDLNDTPDKDSLHALYVRDNEVSAANISPTIFPGKRYGKRIIIMFICKYFLIDWITFGLKTKTYILLIT